MSIAELAAANLLSPAILCFGLGLFAAALRSDLKLPDSVATFLSIYLMLAIGLKGGWPSRSNRCRRWRSRCSRHSR